MATGVYLSAGSNQGDREAHLRSAVSRLGEDGILVERLSPVYETEPWGVGEQPWYLNMVIAANTSLSPQELLLRLQAIESSEGRVRPYPGAPRTLDLDILLYGDRVIDEQLLQIPHPRMAQRRFVLEPLCQVAPDVVHPVLRTTARTLLASCDDAAIVRPYVRS